MKSMIQIVRVKSVYINDSADQGCIISSSFLN